SKTVFSPPFRDKKYSLGVGETYTTSYTSTVTTNYNGLPPTSSSETVNYVIKYLGRETVTVPAGTFTDACKFKLNTDLIQWEAVGKGVMVKSISSTNVGQSVTLELTSGTLNGSPIN